MYETPVVTHALSPHLFSAASLSRLRLMSRGPWDARLCGEVGDMIHSRVSEPEGNVGRGYRTRVTAEPLFFANVQLAGRRYRVGACKSMPVVGTVDVVR